jgi:hypothetical protein
LGRARSRPLTSRQASARCPPTPPPATPQSAHAPRSPARPSLRHRPSRSCSELTATTHGNRRERHTCPCRHHIKRWRYLSRVAPTCQVSAPHMTAVDNARLLAQVSPAPRLIWLPAPSRGGARQQPTPPPAVHAGDSELRAARYRNLASCCACAAAKPMAGPQQSCDPATTCGSTGGAGARGDATLQRSMRLFGRPVGVARGQRDFGRAFQGRRVAFEYQFRRL